MGLTGTVTTDPGAITTVLFDFDDTLAPSLRCWAHAYQVVLGRFGVGLDEAAAWRCLHRDWDDVAAEHGVCSAAELRELVHAQLPVSYADVQLFPGAAEVLGSCRAAGLRVAMVTSSPSGLIRGVAGRLGILGHFEALVCADHVSRLKPDPEPVLAALGALGRSPGEALMVGDSHVDVLAGRAAGTRTAVLLPSGLSDSRRARLQALAPDHELDDLGGVLAVLGLRPA